MKKDQKKGEKVKNRQKMVKNTLDSEKDSKKDEKDEHKPDEKVLNAIRERYIGGKRKRRMPRRYSERKFVFDWDAGEDTSRDYDELYMNPHQIQLFGRGKIAGIDPKVVYFLPGSTKASVSFL